MRSLSIGILAGAPRVRWRPPTHTSSHDREYAAGLSWRLQRAAGDRCLALVYSACGSLGAPPTPRDTSCSSASAGRAAAAAPSRSVCDRRFFATDVGGAAGTAAAAAPASSSTPPAVGAAAAGGPDPRIGPASTAASQPQPSSEVAELVSALSAGLLTLVDVHKMLQSRAARAGGTLSIADLRAALDKVTEVAGRRDQQQAQREGFDRLMGLLGAAFLEALPAAHPADVVGMLHTFAKLGQVPGGAGAGRDRILSALRAPDFLQPILSSPQPSLLVDLMWALANLGLHDPPLYAAIADAAKQRMDSLATRQLTKYAYACGLADYENYPTFSRLVQVRGRPGGGLLL